ncbi:MAG: EVE domain-containing protein [Mesorhizobium sp.]|uniref:EVE domain-containing protein n=1 Tax=Mesorhizobium sp. TaxID=1871066 RepID=UPI000FD574B8|nr:EVE domain-containing protein [Mesorhizobium sp.]RUX09829.1 EVE domain-containing protein [Mesorhizobium sp. M8A.F.Ca.ET.059.01.1.1]RWF42028.1 MAG: EVE domain-containing protein [Mesorhizobium sp.]TIU48510.1 MAG: EVE domain-containing protein [Mesorhizobium sp.]
MSAYWIAVASAQHVRRGRQGGFMQVNHGKAAPLRRVRPGDGIVYYSPTTVLGEKDGLQAFTAIGTVREGEPYQGEMGGGFTPFRRDVGWAQAGETPIKPLLERLEFTAGKSNWGYQLRFGLFPISAADFALIARAMGAKLASTSP